MEALLSARLGAGSWADGMKEDVSFVLKELTNKDGDGPHRPAFNNSITRVHTKGAHPPTAIALSLQTHPLASGRLHFPPAPRPQTLPTSPVSTLPLCCPTLIHPLDFSWDVISSRKKCCWPPRPGKGGSSVLAWFLSTHHFPYCGIFHNSEWISCLFIYLSPTGWNHYEGRILICCVHYIHRYVLNIKKNSNSGRLFIELRYCPKYFYEWIHLILWLCNMVSTIICPISQRRK